MVQFANSPFTAIDTAITRSSRPVVFCKKEVPAYFANFARLVFKEVAVLQSLTSSKKRFQNRWFICELCKISHNIFLKEPFGRLLLHKHSFCLLSQHGTSSFQKLCYTYFPAEYFLDLIYRLVTRVSSIFQTLSQKSIFNPVEHLRWRFFVKIVNNLKLLSIFAKKLYCRCSTRF